VTLLVIAVLFGVQLIVSGIFRLVAAFAIDEAGAGTRVLLALLGIFSIIVGLWAVRHVLLTLVALIIFLGIYWVVSGTIDIFTARSHRGMPDRGWTVFMGLLSIVAGIIVLVWPGAEPVRPGRDPGRLAGGVRDHGDRGRVPPAQGGPRGLPPRPVQVTMGPGRAGPGRRGADDRRGAASVVEAAVGAGDEPEDVVVARDRS
jgi:hypothetical protein